MLISFLLAQVFTYCPQNPVYDRPNGEVVEELPEKFLVSISDVYSRYGRFQNTDPDWTEFLMTDYKGNVIDEKTYWLRSDGCWGVFIER